VIRWKLEGEKLERDKRIKGLEKEVSALQKKPEEEQAARKVANKASSKAKKELEKEREAHEKELGAFASRSHKVMERYRNCLCSVGADTKFPRVCTLEEFMS
jgi:hypothetical protein